jgi:hypothetical protein
MASDELRVANEKLLTAGRAEKGRCGRREKQSRHFSAQGSLRSPDRKGLGFEGMANGDWRIEKLLTAGGAEQGR